MDYLRQIEDDLTNLGQEAKKYPEVKDASDRALQSLRVIREVYVSDIMKKDPNTSSIKQRKFPTSSDLSSPYLLACNYTDGNVKLVTIALNGIHMLLNFEVVPTGEVKNILRVLTIQASSGKSDHHMKILQILLLVVNLLSSDETNFQYLTESTLKSLITLCLQIGEGRHSISLASTALATASQVIEIVVREAQKIHLMGNSVQMSSNIMLFANLIVSDLINFSFISEGDWVKGVNMPQSNALDILHDLILMRKELFQSEPTFMSIFNKKLIPELKKQLMHLREDFLISVSKFGTSSAAAISSRVVRLARCVLIHYNNPMFVEINSTIVTLLLHLLEIEQLDDNVEMNINPLQSKPRHEEYDKQTSIFSIYNGNSLISKLVVPTQNKPNSMKNFQSGPNVYITLVKVDSNNSISPIMTTRLLNAFQIPCHPAGCCLETLLSFFLSDLSHLIDDTEGSRFLSVILQSTIQSVSAFLSSALSSDSNCKEFDSVIRGSQLTTLLEGVLSGAEVDVDFVLKSVHELLLSSSSIEPPEVMVLSFELLQVCVRLLIKFALYKKSLHLGENEITFSVSPEVLKNLPYNIVIRSQSSILTFLHAICENCFQSIHDSCLILLSKINCAPAIRRSFGMLSELSVFCGLAGSVKACNVIVATLCKLSIPRWHVSDIQRDVEVESIKWRHIQGFVRLVQIVHMLADYIHDWDIIVDSFAQLFEAIQSKSIITDGSITNFELEKVQLCFERFKSFSIFITDESLVKLMSSLVALSLNGIGENQPVIQPYGGGLNEWPSYLKDAFGAGNLSFSFKAIVDITKFNSYRVSSVWQMVMSHFRQIASQKSSKLRALALSATNDVISSALSFMMKPSISYDDIEFITAEAIPDHISSRVTVSLSDEIIFSWIMPSFETVFSPRSFHKVLLIDRTLTESRSKDVLLLKLSRNDLLSSLKTLSTVNYDDVKNGVLNGLLLTLQNDGHLFQGAWKSVVEVLEQVPQSIDFQVATPSNEDALALSSDEGCVTNKWPKTSLAISFTCMKLIVDDFQDLLNFDDNFFVLNCLSAFSSQVADVNISLTSIEMIWKVSDFAANDARVHNNISGEDAIIKLMMNILKEQSSDLRPEIRHCAMNTLFGSIVVNSSKLTILSWKFIFHDILFPVLDYAGVRSAQAMKDNENAVAPELKKGVKMTIHHSRDTAHKQWAETQVLALKGLSRVLRACVKHLLNVDWFSSTWVSISQVCKACLSNDLNELEVSTASLDCMFSMLKLVSITSEVTRQNVADICGVTEFTSLELARDQLWTQLWSILISISFLDINTSELSYHFCQKLSEYFNSNIEAEFRYNKIIRELLVMICVLCRPRDQSVKTQGTSLSSYVQFQRCAMEIFRKLKESDLSGLVTALSEISFSCQSVKVGGEFSERNIILRPCPIKLRLESGSFLASINKSIMLSDPKSDTTKNRDMHINGFKVFDTSVKVFVERVFQPLIQRKLRNLSGQSIPCQANTEVSTHLGDIEVIPAQESQSSDYFGIFSSVTRFLRNSHVDHDEQAPLSNLHVNFNQPNKDAGINTVPLPILIALDRDNPTKSYWIPFNAINEIVLMRNLISDSKSFSNTWANNSWVHISQFLMCVTSPWKSVDLDPFESNLDQKSVMEEISVCVCQILTMIYDTIIDQNVHLDIVNKILSSTVDSMRLSFLATFDVWNDISDENENYKVGFAKFYEVIWVKIKDLLLRLYDSTQNTIIQQLTIKALLILTSDISNYAIRSYNAVSYDGNYNPLLEICNSYFLSLILIQSTLYERFDSEYSTPNELELTMIWLKSFTEIKPVIATQESDLKIDQSYLSGELQFKAHLFTLLPYAQKIVAIYDGVHSSCALRLKATSLEIMDAIDLRSLFRSLMESTEEIKRLQQENKKLRDEIIAVKSAAALPF